MITTQEILYIILQTLKALNYLHGKRIIHKDIAARNCWYVFLIKIINKTKILV